MTKPKFVRDVPRVNPLCRLCGHALSSAKHVICEWCLGRCMNCGAPADPSTAGQSERVGRLCIPCSDVDPTGAITLWAAAFGQLTEPDRTAQGEAFLRATGLMSFAPFQRRPSLRRSARKAACL